MPERYQDTNLLQADITRLLAGPERNLMVVGDDAQSIYAFRGACFRNLFDFHREFREARLVTLEENYRSTQPILDVANALMAQTSRSFRKRLRAQRGDRLTFLFSRATARRHGFGWASESRFLSDLPEGLLDRRSARNLAGRPRGRGRRARRPRA